MSNFFLERLHTKCGVETRSRPFSWKLKLSILCISVLKFYSISFYYVSKSRANKKYWAPSLKILKTYSKWSSYTFLYFQKRNFLNLRLKQFLIFLKWNVFKKLGSELPKIKKPTLKKFLIFQEIKISCLKLKKILGETFKAPKTKISYNTLKKVMNKFF